MTRHKEFTYVYWPEMDETLICVPALTSEQRDILLAWAWGIIDATGAAAALEHAVYPDIRLVGRAFARYRIRRTAEYQRYVDVTREAQRKRRARIAAAERRAARTPIGDVPVHA